jgi:8-oxo-dGTP pyrophosphatase MutT (NUDIX family)
VVTEQDRFRKWGANAGEPTPDAVPAATVIPVRDTDHGLEALMLRRNSKLAFAGGMWVFPGGRVDPDDAGDDELHTARRAATREAREEAALEFDETTLVVYSHWVPPPIAPKRFATWFFLAPAPAGEITIDGGEIHEHGWFRPADALARREALEIELAPPTWVTLNELAAFDTVDAAVAATRERRPERYTTHIAVVDGGVVALWHGDAGYDDDDADRPGPRHRLWMLDEGWRFERG